MKRRIKLLGAIILMILSIVLSFILFPIAALIYVLFDVSYIDVMDWMSELEESL